MIWRPSPKTPLSAIAVHQICSQVLSHFSYGSILSLLVSDATLSERMAADNRMALVSFTGSSHVGSQVAQVVAQRMGRYLLECSGNNAIILDKSADLQLAIRAIVFAAVGTAGQRCTTVRRLMIDADIYDQVVEQLVLAYQSITIGNPLDTHNLMGT